MFEVEVISYPSQLDLFSWLANNFSVFQNYFVNLVKYYFSYKKRK